MAITLQRVDSTLLLINKGTGGSGDLNTDPLKKLRPDFIKETNPKELLLPRHLPSLAKTSRF